MTNQEERFALATHFYVRLRRHLNRVVDAVWMAQNDDYAREIIRLARTHGDPELQILCDRFEALTKGGSSKIRVPLSPAAGVSPSSIESRVAEHYIGALR